MRGSSLGLPQRELWQTVGLVQEIDDHGFKSIDKVTGEHKNAGEKKVASRSWQLQTNYLHLLGLGGVQGHERGRC